jgi:ParB-like nuclease domain
VSEFERSRSFVPPFIPSSPRPDTLVDDESYDDGSSLTNDPAFPREGLPAGFRMRHDAHYVEQLTNRTGVPQLRLLPLRDIDAPRAEGDLTELTRSIATYGVLQPILVRSRGGRFELVAGARRFAAAGALGLSEIPSIVVHLDDAGARAVGEQENVRVLATPPAPVLPSSPDVTPAGLRELTQSFSTIGSCLHLLADREAQLRDRVALDLIRTEVHRAFRLVQALNVLAQEPSLVDAAVSLPALFEQVHESFTPEKRLSGATVTVEVAEGPQRTHGDAEWLATAIAGAFGGMLALVQGTRQPAVHVAIGASHSRSSLKLEIAQTAVSVPTWALDRFFDLEWTDRQGGYQAAVELAATRRILDLSGGSVDIVAGDRGGCRLVLLFAAA